MTETKIDNTWVNRLIEDCLSIKVERSHNAEMELIQGRYEIGQRLLEDHNNFVRDKIYGKKILQRVAESIKMKERSLNYCIAFSKKYKTWKEFLSKAPKGKAISWRFICQEILTKHKIKEESKKQIKKDDKISKLVNDVADHPEKKEYISESIMKMFESEKEKNKRLEIEVQSKDQALKLVQAENKKLHTENKNLKEKIEGKKKEDNIQDHVNKKPYADVFDMFFAKIHPDKKLFKNDGKYNTGLKNISKLDDMTPERFREVMEYLFEYKDHKDFDLNRITKNLNPQIIYSNIQLITNMLGKLPGSKKKKHIMPDWNAIANSQEYKEKEKKLTEKLKGNKKEGFFDEPSSTKNTSAPTH